MQAVELLAHTPCSGGGGGCPCPENVLRSGDTMIGFLTLNANPTNPLHAATKQYVDTLGTSYVLKSGDTMTGLLTLSGDPVNALQASTKQYADTKVSIAGSTMTGFLTLHANPTLNLHAATKQYVDSAISAGPYVLKAGDTMTGQLTMQSNIALTANSTRISQVSTSTWSGDAGAGFGKLEYHSNRWYINAGSDSAQIVEFRRGGSATGHVANDGRFNIPFWTTSGRNNSNEWIQFNNHSGLYSPLNNAHFYPNNLSYGSWRIAGDRNSWQGLEFDTSDGQKSLMMGAAGAPTYTGVHHNGKGWRWYIIETGAHFVQGVPMNGNNTGFWGGAPAFGVPAWNLMGSYQFFNPSDQRFKDNIRDIPLGLSFIKKLRPVEYTNIYPRWIKVGNIPGEEEDVLEWEIGHRLRSGLLAQNVKEALESEGVGDYSMWSLAEKDDPDSFQVLSYHEFIAPLVKAVQELSQRIETLESK
jgi:hypothetical protein